MSSGEVKSSLEVVGISMEVGNMPCGKKRNKGGRKK